MWQRILLPALLAVVVESLGLALPVGAQHALHLDDVLAQVVEANPSLRAARLNAEALAQRGRQARSLPDPTLGVGLRPWPLLAADGFERGEVRAEQMLPYPGKRDLQGAVADLSADVAAYEADALAEDLLLQAKLAYYDLYRVQQLEGLVEAFRSTLQDYETVATRRYEVGAGMQQAILKAQLEKNQLTQRLLALRTERRAAAETLARLTNRSEHLHPAATIRLAPPPIPALDDTTLLAVAVRARPEVAALDAAADRARQEEALARKQFLPDFGVSLGLEFMPETGGLDALAVGAMLQIPLDRGRRRAQLEEARLRQAEVAARQEALRLELRTRIESLRYALEQDAEALRLYDQMLLPQAAATVEATLSAYTTDRTDFLDLLDAERSLFALRTGYEDAQARYLQTTALLERALGIPSLQALDAYTVATP